MKKLFLVLALAISSITYSQFVNVTKEVTPIKKTVVSRPGVFIASMNFYDDSVLLGFQDAKNPTVSHIKMVTLTLEELKSFRTLILETDNKVGDIYQMKTANDGTITISFSKLMGIIYPIISVEHNGLSHSMIYLTERQWKKLFDVS